MLPDALLAGIHDEVIQVGRRLGTYLLCELHHSGSGVLTNHELTDFLVAHGNAQLLVLLLEELLVDHIIQHLLLTCCGINLLVVLVLRSLLLYTTLESHNVNFLIADFCGCAVATGTADGLDTYLDNESEQCGTDDDGEDLFPLPNFL